MKWISYRNDIVPILCLRNNWLPFGIRCSLCPAVEPNPTFFLMIMWYYIPDFFWQDLVVTRVLVNYDLSRMECSDDTPLLQLSEHASTCRQGASYPDRMCCYPRLGTDANDLRMLMFWTLKIWMALPNQICCYSFIYHKYFSIPALYQIIYSISDNKVIISHTLRFNYYILWCMNAFI